MYLYNTFGANPNIHWVVFKYYKNGSLYKNIIIFFLNVKNFIVN